MDMQAAISKAARLLRLAKSDNPHEAALAAARAQEIIDRYKLSGVELDLRGKPKDEEVAKEFSAPLFNDGGSMVPAWVGRLGLVVARANQCRCYSVGGHVRLIGRPSDAEAVRYLFAFLRNEVDRLTKRDATGNGRTWANNFRLGCIDTIQKVLAEQTRATVAAVQQEAKSDSAIVLVRNSLARIEQHSKDSDAVAAKLGLRTTYSRATYHDGARSAGREAAKEIKLGARNSMVGGYRELGS